MTALSQFKTWVFDCDGVLLDSNKVKTRAFLKTAEPYGNAPAQELVNYHVRNGGVSRYVKFRMFLADIMGRGSADPDELQHLLSQYAGYVREGLKECLVAQGLASLRDLTPSTRWLVASGGDQNELREIFEERELAQYFDGGIFGSPDTKDDILSREIRSGSIVFPAVFVGDSRYDVEAAERAGLEFIFARRWSEADYTFPSAILDVEGIDSLVSLLRENR